MRAKIVLTLIASLALTAPSAAEITDLRARLDGDAGQIWIALDEQPAGLISEVSQAGLTLTLDGVSLRARAISPASDTLVAAVTIDPTEQGAIVRLHASRSWTGARAELRQGGVLVSMMVGPTPEVHVAAGALRSDGGMSPANVPPSDRAPMPTSATGSENAIQATPEPAQSVAPATSAPAAPTPLFASNDGAAQAARSGTSVVPPGVCTEAAQAVAESPWDDDLLHAQAACLNDGGYHAAAASIYEQMLAFEPENFRATVALAEIRVEQGDEQAARALYDQAARHAISDAEAARARSRLRALREQ
ncbi:tetratricopeptide repeat protein [Maricaulis maris]|uniref:Uncharacterized protein n=1 Tax=Maricaulis maris TaxID=74318 RepID=A0A495DPI9_9PROT|nr:tetratricopeptide repeat protein [Maricaulis maris]RKR03919.1 hypothetical protein C7435_0362 [Maricaulis maris]